MITLNKRGDTIIEVVLAMALLTSVLFTAWSITNRATIIQRAARERVQMVNEVKEQAELVKAQWAEDSQFASSYLEGSIPSSDPCANEGANVWYLRIDTGSDSIEKVDDVKEIDGSEDKRVWVQTFNRAGYQEFYVRACWINNSGISNKTESSQVILRLNT